MHPFVNVGVSAARKAGNVILRGAERRDSMVVDVKKANDFVTETDRKAEQVIIEIIQNSYPAHDILGEESGVILAGDKPGDIEWIIDPLDGTTNFIHGFPHYCVSIGVREKGRLEHAIIFDPLKNELFTASRGSGAMLDGKKLRMPRRAGLAGCLIGTDLPYHTAEELSPYMKMLNSIMLQSTSVRRSGSAALDLAYVAAGRLDGVWALKLKPWDMAAGALLVQEAGGIIGGIDGGTEFMDSGNVIAGSPKVFAALSREAQTALKT